MHYFLETTPLIEVSSDNKVMMNVNKFRDLIEALPAGVITVGSFFHPHLCGSPKLPFIMPVRELLKSKIFGHFKYVSVNKTYRINTFDYFF